MKMQNGLEKLQTPGTTATGLHGAVDKQPDYTNKEKHGSKTESNNVPFERATRSERGLQRTSEINRYRERNRSLANGTKCTEQDTSGRASEHRQQTDIP